MHDLRALVAAAGRGTRAGLPYPKTLFPIQGKPILVRITELLTPYDSEPTVIVSPDGERPVLDCLLHYGRPAHLVVQPEPRGMGDAVLRFAESPAFDAAEHVLLLWGDIPLIQTATVAALVSSHYANASDFTFATRMVESAYTVVSRSLAGEVCGVLETRELGMKLPQAGERDIGLFVFRKSVVMELLREELDDKWGRTTGEHGFLYVIGHLARRGFKVNAMPVATELDLVSLNRLEDVDGYA